MSTPPAETEREHAIRGLRWAGAPAMRASCWRTLFVLGALNLFGSYGLALLGLALPQIQSGLGVAEGQVGSLLAWVRLGVIPAFLLTLLADRVGRRRVLLASVVGFTLCTAATGLARTPEEFALLQFLARTFIGGEMMLAVVVITEEFDAGHRGWGIGMLGALGGLGHGLASVCFAAVGALPFGWRSLFFLGVAPLLLSFWFRRNLRETGRFERHRRERDASTGLLAALLPLAHLARMYPRRLIALCATIVPFAFVAETAMMFPSKFLQDVHGYRPGHIALLYLTAGAFGTLGNLVAGALGDRLGRKRVLVGALLLDGAALGLFFNLSGWPLPACWGLMVLSLTMASVLLAALGSELFPTSYRSTASGARAVAGTLAVALGLQTESVLYPLAGGHAGALTWMLAVLPLAPVVVALGLPETANRELEEIAPERAPQRAPTQGDPTLTDRTR